VINSYAVPDQLVTDGANARARLKGLGDRSRCGTPGVATARPGH